MKCPREKVMTIALNFLRKAGYYYPVINSIRDTPTPLLGPAKCIVKCNVGPPSHEEKTIVINAETYEIMDFK